MPYQRARVLAAIGGMALVIFFAALISLLNDGRIALEGQHLLLTLLVGLAAYLGWPPPRNNPDQPDDDHPG